MGGRVGCHVALEEPVTAVVCLGYPLKGAGRRAALRDEVLLALRVPILFVQGTRDPLCPLDLLEPVRARMKARSELHVVEGGNHSLEVARTALKARGETQGDVDATALESIRKFVGASAQS
jgi:predicted alpha/beta-hydrolase family hydrolase